MEPTSFGYDTYLSPFTWRYGSDRMRVIWSEQHKRLLWRQVWVALATVQAQVGLVSAQEVAALQAHAAEVDVAQAHAVEAETRHDLMAELRVFAAQAGPAGGKLHLGATSMDIEDNTDALRIRASLDILAAELKTLLLRLADRIEPTAGQVCMAFTHIQPAEPTTVGYRLAGYAQDLLQDYRQISRLAAEFPGKGLKGAVGTAASYTHLLRSSELTAQQMESEVMQLLGLPAVLIATQVYPRSLDLPVVNTVASIAANLHKFALDLRLLQSPSIGEWSEPFGARQVGSSAMPFKRNPINAETICSLARLVHHLSQTAWDNTALMALERTLDDSANRREALPAIFLAAEEMIIRAQKLIAGLVINANQVQRNLDVYGPFAAIEALLMELARLGADRQAMHETLRGHSLQAWEAVQKGQANPLAEYLAGDPAILKYLQPRRVRELMAVRDYVGDAPQRARQIVEIIRKLDGAV
ncbi:MAG: adenylosuccinate lyase [Chloroflexi bacterium]|nr:adenylosuccinate lyase [Chloroflexota bacterium]